MGRDAEEKIAGCASTVLTRPSLGVLTQRDRLARRGYVNSCKKRKNFPPQNHPTNSQRRNPKTRSPKQNRRRRRNRPPSRRAVRLARGPRGAKSAPTVRETTAGCVWHASTCPSTVAPAHSSWRA